MDHNTIKFVITPIVFDVLNDVITKNIRNPRTSDITKNIYVNTCHRGNTSNAKYATIGGRAFNVVYCDIIEPDEAAVILSMYNAVRKYPPTDNTKQSVAFYDHHQDFNETLLTLADERRKRKYSNKLPCMVSSFPFIRR